MLNDLDPDSQVCIEQSDRLVSKHVMNVWLQFVYVSQRAFSSKILSPQFSFLHEFLTLQSTDRAADDMQTEREEVT